MRIFWREREKPISKSKSRLPGIVCVCVLVCWRHRLKIRNEEMSEREGDNMYVCICIPVAQAVWLRLWATEAMFQNWIHVSCILAHFLVRFSEFNRIEFVNSNCVHSSRLNTHKGGFLDFWQFLCVFSFRNLAKCAASDLFDLILLCSLSCLCSIWLRWGWIFLERTQILGRF